MYLSGKVERVKVGVFFPFWIIVLTSLVFSSSAYSDFSQIIMGDPDLEKKAKLQLNFRGCNAKQTLRESVNLLSNGI